MDKTTFDRYFVIGLGIFFIVLGLRAIITGTATRTRTLNRNDPRYRHRYRRQLFESRDIHETTHHTGLSATAIGALELGAGIFILAFALL